MIHIQKEIDLLRDKINEAISGVIDSGQFILGENVQKFEAELADHIGVDYVVSCASGTDALTLILLALQPDHVYTPEYCFCSTVEVPKLLGIDYTFYNNEFVGELTGTVIYPHLSHDNGGKIHVQGTTIHDLCQHGYDFKAPKEFIGYTSFHPTKALSSFGDGGAVLTNDKGLAEKVRLLRVHGMDGKYNYKHIGLNSRLDEIQAAVLRVKLRHWGQIKKFHKDKYNNFKYPRRLNEYEVYQ